MLDVIGAIFAAALCTAVVGILAGYSPVRVSRKVGAICFAAAWCGVIIAIAALGGLLPGALGALPAGLFPFVGLIALLIAAWFLVPEFRGTLLSVPLPVLIGLNAARLGGLFFVLLYLDGRLSAPFAPAAGFGDMAAGALAIPLAASLALGRRVRSAWVALWNGFGALDLIVAVALGALSAPGTSFRVFTEEPGTLAMTTLPWALIPAILVPLFLLIHLAIAAKLHVGVHADRLVVA